MGWTRHLSVGAYVLGDIFLRALSLAAFVAALNKGGLMWLAVLMFFALLGFTWHVRHTHTRRVAPADLDWVTSLLSAFFQFFTEAPIVFTRHGIEPDDVMDQLYLVVKVVVGTVTQGLHTSTE